MGCSMTTYDSDYQKRPSSKQLSRRKSYQLDDHYFTYHQKCLVRETWSKISHDQIEIGMQIFLKLFELKPEAKALFPFRDLDDAALTSNSLFRCHSMRFMLAIGGTVAHLDALDLSCGPTFVLLGRRHLWIGDFLESGYLDAFVESVACVFEELLLLNGNGNGGANEVHDAWKCVFQFVVDKMVEGYKEALEESRGKACNACNGGAVSEQAKADEINGNLTNGILLDDN